MKGGGGRGDASCTFSFVYPLSDKRQTGKAELMERLLASKGQLEERGKLWLGHCHAG